MTGVTGYLGSALCRDLVREGIQVTGLKRSRSDQRRIAELTPALRLIDVDRPGWSDLDYPFKVDVIVHAATCYGRRGESDAEVLEANIDFPISVIRWGSARGARCFVNIDTVLPAELNRYSRSKAEFRAVAARETAGRRMALVNVRLESMFGPWDDDDKFTSNVIRACARNQPSIDLTRGEQLRDFIYIDDVTTALVAVLKVILRGEGGSAEVGLGTGSQTSVRQFAEMARSVLGSTTRLDFGALPYRAGEPMSSVADVSYLRGLGWTFRYAVEGGIRKIVEIERLT